MQSRSFPPHVPTVGRRNPQRFSSMSDGRACKDTTPSFGQCAGGRVRLRVVRPWQIARSAGHPGGTDPRRDPKWRAGGGDPLGSGGQSVRELFTGVDRPGVVPFGICGAGCRHRLPAADSGAMAECRNQAGCIGGTAEMPGNFWSGETGGLRAPAPGEGDSVSTESLASPVADSGRSGEQLQTDCGGDWISKRLACGRHRLRIQYHRIPHSLPPGDS